MTVVVKSENSLVSRKDMFCYIGTNTLKFYLHRMVRTKSDHILSRSSISREPECIKTATIRSVVLVSRSTKTSHEDRSGISIVLVRRLLLVPIFSV